MPNLRLFRVLRVSTALLACCVAGLVSVQDACAQSSFPTKPVRLVVAFPAGGISDVLARAIAAKMSTTIGQSVFVENKPGAGTTIAGDFITKSAPDGYTIWLQDITSHAINATLYPKLPYDPVKDFTPITLVASTPLMLVVHPSSPAKSVQELIALIGGSAGKYTYGSSGSGTPPHLAGELLKSFGKLDVVHVPYKGSAPSTQAILANEVAFVFSSMPPAVSNVRAGKLRALAVTSGKRVGAAPDVPTMAEAGVPNAELLVYSGILAPPNTPAAIVSRLNDEFARVVASDEVKLVYEKIGADAITNTPDAFRSLIAGEIAKLAPLVRASGAKVE